MNSKNREPQAAVGRTQNRGSEARPRFWQSKVSGWNLRLHPRGVKNNWVSPSIGEAQYYTRLHRTYVDDMRPRQVRLKAAYKDYYLIQGRISYKKHNPTVLERRSDVLLHRSGLVNSIAQARQLVTHGHIYSVVNGIKQIVKNPSHQVQVGEILGVNSNIWVSNTTKESTSCLRKTTASQFKGFIRKVENTDDAGYDRRIPPYVEVDYITGHLILVNKPTRNQIILPAGLMDTVKLW